MPITTRTFRVFVSSTFEDLRAERNILQEEVFPELERFCLEKGARFQAIDLRWGVREEAGLDQKTMEICLAEIARCQKTRIKPNFIVLLGKRYGWRPLPAHIQKDEFETVLANIARTGERDFVASWYDLDLNAVPPEYILKPRKGIYTDWDEWKPVEKRIHDALREGARAAGLSPDALVKYEASATHQEILKGLGETEEDLAHVFAFLLESAGDEDPDLTKLKDHLKAVLPEANIFPYAVGDHDRLSDDVERSLKMVIAATADRFETQSEKASHDRFAEDRAKHFKGREAVLEAIEQYLNGADRRPLLVYGPSGSGKSAIMAVSSDGKNAIRRFIGATPESSSGITLVRSLCRELSERFGQTDDLPATFHELSTMFSERLMLATADQPVILFIDALDQLSAQDQAAAIRWLPAELPPHCHLVLSTTGIPAALRRAAMVPVEPLPVEDAGLALNSWFTEARRTLQQEQREKLLASFSQSGLPLYLRLAFEEVRLWRSFDSPGECVLGDGLPGTIDRLFARLSDPANHGPILVRHALGYLTAARYGLTEDEILAVLTKDDVVWKDVVGEGGRRRHDPPLRQLPVIVWSRLHLDLEPYLTERTVPGGTTVSFYHRQLAKRVETTPLHHGVLAAHFAGQSYWLGADVPNRRMLTELVRQQVGADLVDDAAAVLTDLDFVSAKCTAELVFDLEEDYREAITALPEAKAELKEEERRQAELAQWTRTLIDCAERRRVPKPEEILKSVEPQTIEQIESESKRLTETPTRLDRLKAFAGFIKWELFPLDEFGRRPGFVMQHAFNSTQLGPFHPSPAQHVGSVVGPLFLRVWPPDSLGNPMSALIRTLEGHPSAVLSISMTADGQRIVSGGADGTVRVWNVQTGDSATLQGHTQGVESVVVAADGQRALSGGHDGTLRLWDLEAGTCLRVLAKRRSQVGCVSLTPDGRRAVSGEAFRNCLRVWDLHTGKCVRTIRDYCDRIHTVVVTADGRRALSCGRRHVLSRLRGATWEWDIRVWDLERGKVLRTLEGHRDRVNSLAVTPDGRVALSASEDGTIRVWDLETGSCLMTRTTFANRAASITPDGRMALSGVFYLLCVWDLKTGSCLRELTGDSILGVTSVAITPDGRRAASGYRDGRLRLWNLFAGSSDLLRKSGHAGSVNTVSITPDGRRVVSVGGDIAGVWDMQTGAFLRSIGSFVSCASILPDGQRVVLQENEDPMKMTIWDLETGEPVKALEGTTSSFHHHVTPDGLRAISGDSVWDLETGRHLHFPYGSERDAQSQELSTVSVSGPRILSTNLSGDLLIGDWETGASLQTLKGHESNVTTGDITPDGTSAVSGADDGMLRVWNLETGSCRYILKAHEYGVSGVRVTPDGRKVISRGKGDRNLRLWDLATGACLRVLDGHTREVNELLLTTDGRRALSGSADRTLRVWDLERGECEALLVTTAGISSFSVWEPLNRVIVGTDHGNVEIYGLHGLVLLN